MSRATAIGKKPPAIALPAHSSHTAAIWRAITKAQWALTTGTPVTPVHKGQVPFLLLHM